MSSKTKEWLSKFVSRPDFVHKYPLYTFLLAKLDPVADPSVAVMGVSAHGRRFYLHLNIKYLAENPQFLTGILLHEAHHVVLGHLSHPKFRSRAHPDLLEIAMEVSANEYIREPLPAHPITWEDYREMGLRPGQSTLERYELLAKARREEVMMLRPRWVDDHLAGGVGGVYRVVELDPDTSKEVKSLLEEAAGLSVKQDPTARQPRPLLAGKSPGDLIEELEGTEEEPERFMDWRAALQMFAARLRTPVHTYARPNRRLPRLVGLIPGRAYYPGHVGKPSLIVAIDTSGSMSTEELVEIGRHLVPISSLVKVTIVECDTVIHRTYPFKGTLREVAGRGGTDLRPVFERAFLGKHRPDGVVYFTDGFGPYPEKDPRIQTLWVLTKPHEFQCPWGQRALLERSSNRLPLQTCGRARRHFCCWKTPSSDG